MADYYLSISTIQESYKYLTEEKIKYETELFFLLILKHAGLSQHEYINLLDESTKRKMYDAVKRLGYLFVSDKHNKEKYNFINPLAMRGWGNNPSESMYAWISNRLANNVTGGGKQWKAILINDPSDVNSLKLKHDYMDFFGAVENKIPLSALAVWFAKFNSFNSKLPLSRLQNNFCTYFNITAEEKTRLFSMSAGIILNYSDQIVDSSEVRELIGNPVKEPDWLTATQTFDSIEDLKLGDVIQEFELGGGSLSSGKIQAISYYKDVLDKSKQMILMGPPGTSKSYMAKEISEEFDVVKRIQFHPQYSYQDFIGGKILENGTLKDKKGQLVTLIDEAILDDKKQFLLIIEEINRANVSQVFGEMIQLLDRGDQLELTFDGVTKMYSLPDNIKIIGTMNTTDRTVGRIDYAIKRRFFQIYFGVDLGILVDNVSLSLNEFSIADLLTLINTNLLAALKNKEMVIGHAIFLKDYVFDITSNKFIWTTADFEGIFNYVVLPIIEDYCNGNVDLVANVIGEKLLGQLTGDDFVQAVQEYLS